MVATGYIKKYVVASFWLAVFITLSAHSVGAQEVPQDRKVKIALQGDDRERIYGKAGVSLACAPSPNGVDYICYKKPEGGVPTLLDRVGHWLFRLVRDPIAVFTFLLLCVGVRQVGISQRTAHRQLRAYLAPDFTSITDGSSLTPPSDVGLVRGATVIKNSGQTPAYDVQTWAEIDIARTSEENRLVAPEQLTRISMTSIGPGGATTHTRHLGRALTDHEVSEVQTSKSAIYIYGNTEYRDVFGKKHTTNFRLKYSGVWPPVGTPNMTYCEAGNDAD